MIAIKVRRAADADFSLELNHDDTVRFTIDSSRDDNWIDVCIRDGELLIRGGYGLMIRPEVSNCIRLTIAEWRTMAAADTAAAEARLLTLREVPDVR